MKLLEFFERHPTRTAVRRSISVRLVKGALVATEDDDEPCVYALTLADFQAEDWRDPIDEGHRQYLPKLREIPLLAPISDEVLLQIIAVIVAR